MMAVMIMVMIMMTIITRVIDRFKCLDTQSKADDDDNTDSKCPGTRGTQTDDGDLDVDDDAGSHSQGPRLRQVGL